MNSIRNSKSYASRACDAMEWKEIRILWFFLLFSFSHFFCSFFSLFSELKSVINEQSHIDALHTHDLIELGLCLMGFCCADCKVNMSDECLINHQKQFTNSFSIGSRGTAGRTPWNNTIYIVFIQLYSIECCGCGSCANDVCLTIAITRVKCAKFRYFVVRKWLETRQVE